MTSAITIIAPMISHQILSQSLSISIVLHLNTHIRLFRKSSTIFPRSIMISFSEKSVDT